MTNSEYQDKILRKLGVVGSKIVNHAIDGDTFGLVIETENGERHVLWVLQDPEGNGPGFLESQKI